MKPALYKEEEEEDSQNATQPDSTVFIHIVFIDFRTARTNEQSRGVLF